MRKNWILYLVLIALMVSFPLGSTVTEKRENKNRFIHNVFNDCNMELAYTLNTLHQEVFHAEKEKLKDKQYVSDTFYKAYEGLRLWEKVMGDLYLLDEGFNLQMFDLQYYLTELRDMDNLTDRELENLEKIIRISTRINPGKDEIIKGSYRFRIYPDEKVWNTLLEMRQLSREGLERLGKL